MALLTPRRLLTLLSLALVWSLASLLLDFLKPSATTSGGLALPNRVVCTSSAGYIRTADNISYSLFDPPLETNALAEYPLKASAPPDGCLDNSISTGNPCTRSESAVFDVIWTYVNGSDPLHQSAYRKLFAGRYRSGSRPNIHMKPEPKQFRDHDELRHSMRSVLRNFRPYVAHFHVLTADFAIHSSASAANVTECDAQKSRLGQVPQWLDEHLRTGIDGRTSLSVWHHSQFFSQYEDTVFNSFAIESQMSNLPNLGEHFLYLNDDFFLMTQLRPADFYTQAYGIVLRLQPDALVTPASKSGTASRGEWLALEHSNEILSRRFGYRKRPYLVHQVKTGSRPLMHEMGLVFKQAMRSTAQNTFRARPEGEERDVHATWLFANFVVERWREALLWSWTVARIGASDDSWYRTVALQEFGAEGSGTVTVSPGYRHTLAHDQLLANLGAEDMPKRTKYEFSSADGYPFAFLTGSTGSTSRSHWPRLSDVATSTGPSIGCFLVVDDCFPRHLTSASAVFKHIAFKNIQCGDCVIKALVAKSGVMGLEAFLPYKQKIITPDTTTAATTVPAHLPLVSDWKQADYRRRAVVGGANIREWTLRLLARYKFVIGSTPSHFLSISSPRQARNALAKVQIEDGAALLCVNDNIAMRPDETSQVFREWQEGMWGERMAWERNPT